MKFRDQFFKVLLIYGTFFGALYLFQKYVIKIDDSGYTLDSWGVVIFGVIVCGWFVLHSYSVGVITSLMQRLNLQAGLTVRTFADRISDWTGYAVAFAVTSWLAPQYASCPSVFYAICWAVVVGAVAAICKLLAMHDFKRRVG